MTCIIHTEKVRTDVSSVSSKYITAKVCHESHHRCPICGLYYAGKFTGTIDIALAVCLIKMFCLTEWAAANGRLLGTEWRRHDSIAKLQNKLKATHTLPISLILWSPGFPLIFDHFKAVISSEGLSINSTDCTLTKWWMCDEKSSWLPCAAGRQWSYSLYSPFSCIRDTSYYTRAHYSTKVKK